jgi:L-lactate dehydrogenase complex protein LldF
MSHPQQAQQFVQNTQRMHWHDKALWFVRQKRDTASKTLPEWEKLRSYASAIKTHTMSKLDVYLQEFEKNAQQNGIIVHWANDAKEHNKIVHHILEQHGAKKIVKSKSMLTEECHLNPYLEQKGMEVIDTDLGERIVQLRQEPPSHIVLPAIHLKKEEVGETFHQFLNSEEGNSDPTYLTQCAREHLRQKFLNADAAITGVNFAIAQTGGFVVCTNEGNADMGAHLPKLHIACMGIEKMIPRFEDLAVFTRLLARSATGQPITTYTSIFQKPKKDSSIHVVIVNNKRTPFLQNEKYKQSLNCIRCGACMNTCPVYRRSGGHAYGYVIPGPIGSTLGAFRDGQKHQTLPFACTLCASCSNVCPSKIDLHKQLYAHRQDLVNEKIINTKKEFILKITAWTMQHPWLFDTLGKMARKIIPLLPKSILYTKNNAWTKHRTLMDMPKHSFKELYKQKRKEDVK